MSVHNLKVPKDKIAEFCKKHGIIMLALFGSILRDDFGPSSDIDVLVQFDDERTPGLFALAAIERELSVLFGGRKIDIRTPFDLSRYFRDEVVSEAEVQYAEER